MSGKSKLIITIVVSLIVGVIGFYILGSNGSWEQYSNSRYGFTVDYPSSWKLGEAPDNNDGREFISPDGSVSCRAYGFQNALVNSDGEPQTLYEFIAWLTDYPGIVVIDRSDRKFAGRPSTHIVFEQNGVISSAVYTLKPDVGYGFVCSYQSKESQKKHTGDFQHMTGSFRLVSSLKENVGNTVISCGDYIGGVITPLQDQQVFLDETYTEVTITSREAWDRSRLPSRVIDLENIDYTCYPMPFEMIYPDEKMQKINAQPEVQSVEWTCELEHTNYKFVKDGDAASQKTKLESNGYSCAEQSCFGDDNKDSFVWLCTRLAQ